MVIDAHQHLWETSRFSRPWLSGTLARDFSWDDYEAATQGMNFEAAVYVETGVAAEHRAEEARWILEWQRHDKRIAGAVISVDPWDENFAESFVALSAYPGLKGVRPAIRRQAGHSPLLNAPFLRAMETLGERNLCCDLLIGAEELNEATSLAKQRRDTRFVLDHCGNPGPEGESREAWKQGIVALAECPNVSCKVSGIVGASPDGIASAASLGPIVRHCAETFGPERLLFGSDWPVCTLYASVARWKSLLDEIIADWSATDKRRLFHNNAIRIYRLLEN